MRHSERAWGETCTHVQPHETDFFYKQSPERGETPSKKIKSVAPRWGLIQERNDVSWGSHEYVQHHQALFESSHLRCSLMNSYFNFYRGYAHNTCYNSRLSLRPHTFGAL